MNHLLTSEAALLRLGYRFRTSNVGFRKISQSSFLKSIPNFNHRDENISFRCSKCESRRNVHINQPKIINKQLHREVNAIARMFHRSGIQPSTKFLQEMCRPAGLRWFSSSGGRGQQQPGGHQSSGQDGNKQDEGDQPSPGSQLAAVVLQAILVIGLYFLFFKEDSTSSPKNDRFVSWNEFLHDMLAKGEVEEIIVHPDLELAQIKLHRGAIIKNKSGNYTYAHEDFLMKIVDVHKFEDKLRKAEAELGIRPEKGVSVSYKRHGLFSNLLRYFIVGSIILAMVLVTRRMFSREMQSFNSDISESMFGKTKFVRGDLQPAGSNSITFKDVAGLHEAKVEVMEFVDYLKRPQRYKELGARIPHGALLLGPPGCGKTLLAKALATEAGVPFLAMAGSEFVEMVGGLGASRVRNLFKQAREEAPCIIYIDEIDAIGRRRSGKGGGSEGGGMDGNSEEEHTLNQLLVEMDGMDTVEGVIMIGSTNRHEVLDKALLRPGRFDRHIMIDYPTLAERKETFELYLGKLATVKPPREYSERLAQLSPGMTGADIANICNEAALHAARDKKKAIGNEDFEYAVERVVAGVAKKSRVLSEVEKRVVAYHEAGHAVIGWMLEHTDALLKVSIVPRTNKALGFAQYMPGDQKLFSKEQIFERMCMALGGRVAESITFNRVTSGAQDDLKKVTDMAYKWVRELGMNDTVGHVSFPHEQGGEFGGKPYSKALAALMDNEAKQLVAQAYKHTEEVMKVHKEKLRRVAEALLEKESLNYSDMEELIGPRPHGKGLPESAMKL